MANTKKAGLFIGTNGEIRPVTIDTKNGLKDYYRLIKTDIVERTSAQIYGKSVEIWCDEEGLLKQSPINVTVNVLAKRLLVGNVVIHGRSLAEIIARLRDVDGYWISEGEHEPVTPVTT
jgi:uncharacterized protein DUF3846